MFWKSSWVCSRCAGSGSMPLPMPDLIAGKAGRILAIECKSGKDKRYLTKKEVDELKEFGSKLGAEAWIGARFNNNEWFFIKPENLGKNRGKNFFVNVELAKQKGLKFNELILMGKNESRE